jgi:hypothetical protein
MKYNSLNNLCILAISFLLIVPIVLMGQKSKPISNDPDFRQIAVSTLENSLDESRKIEDLSTRVTITEKIVRLIKDSSTENCKRAVDRLYESIIDAKKLSENNNFESQLSGVIKIAAIIDKKFAEKYIEKYNFEIKSENKQNKSEKDTYSQALIYLAIATQLLETNPNLSVDVAENSTKIGIFNETLGYLVKLKEKDTTLSDTFANKALTNVKNRNAKDINEVFIIYAFIFNKSNVPFVNSNNLSYIPTRYFKSQSVVNPSLAKNFIQITVQLLSNQARTTLGSASQAKHGALGDYFFVKIIEPLSQQYNSELQSSIANLQSVLYNFLDQEKRSSINSSIDSWNTSANTNPATKKGKDYWLERAENTENKIQKDA